VAGGSAGNEENEGGHPPKSTRKKRRDFELCYQPPRQKAPQISPIFISDKVTLHVSREKDGKLRLVYAGWDDAKVVRPDDGGQVRGGWKGWILPPARGSPPPRQKSRPPRDPPFFTQR
jgi:hypothetical protein